jgi:dynein heavy chain
MADTYEILVKDILAIFRLAFYEFINNEDVRKMFVFIKPPRQIIAALQPPHDLKYKSIFFLKSNTGTKITKDNISE